MVSTATLHQFDLLQHSPQQTPSSSPLHLHTAAVPPLPLRTAPSSSQPTSCSNTLSLETLFPGRSLARSWSRSGRSPHGRPEMALPYPSARDSDSPSALLRTPSLNTRWAYTFCSCIAPHSYTGARRQLQINPPTRSRSQVHLHNVFSPAATSQ